MPARFFTALPHALAVLCLLLAVAGPAYAQTGLTERGADLLDRPISSVRVEGTERVSKQLVRNNIRASAGDPYDPDTVIADVRRLTRLAEFKFVDAVAQLEPDGTVALLFAVQEAEMIAVVQVVGNKLISDQELLDVVRLIEGGPRDDFLIDKAERSIAELYRERGHYLVAVEIDESQLERAGVLIFRVFEGPRVRIRAIEFVGNTSFSAKQLRAQISTSTAIWLMRKGQLDSEKLTDDVAALDRYYKGEGFLDVRVDRRIELSPDNTEAKVVFLIAEGPRYTLASVRTVSLDAPGQPIRVFHDAQVAAILEIKTGDVFRQNLLRKSVLELEDSYGLLGYLDVDVRAVPVRRSDEAEVDLVLEIAEGRQFTVGAITIGGNFLTRDKVIRRLVRLRPGRPFDGGEIERSRDRIERTRLFGRNSVRITVQEPLPDEPEVRDVFVEVKEANTGSFNFGVALGSDSGAIGEFSLRQDNFDIADPPRTLSELVKGRAFRGGGQKFSAALRPGTEIFEYSMSITEPHFLESDVSMSVSGAFRAREFDDYDEERITLPVNFRRRLGDVWEIGLATRFERVKLDDIDADAPTEVFLDAGPDSQTSIGVRLVRSTITTITRPGKGSRFEFGYDRVGALGGDLDFDRVTGEYTVFITLDEDFLGRKSILKLNTDVGYIFNGRAPTYERFYLGGRSFRGFDFREVSPKGIRADNGEPSDKPVGGSWKFFAGAQYEFPLFQEAITGVFFVDSGTVIDDPGFDEYRVSVGGGIRLYVAAFGPVPIAFDFAVPVRKEDEDEEQVFSFSAELPF